MQIIYSNSHESLLERLCQKIQSEDSRHVLIFPSHALKVFYSDQLCNWLGSTLSLDLILPDEIPEISMELGACCPTRFMKKSWRSSDYRLALLQLFLQLERETDPQVLKWVSGSPLEIALQKNAGAKSAMASSLARLFCSYSQWALSRESFSKAIVDWQTFLWHEVHKRLEIEGCLAWQWLDLVDEMQPFCQDVQLHLIGFSQAAPGFLKWVEKAQQPRSALWYVHSPSRLYWHDLESYLRGEKQLAKLTASANAYDHFQAFLLDRNPLLASLCQVARPLMQYLEMKQSDSVDAYKIWGSIEGLQAYQELWWQEIEQAQKPLNKLTGLQTDLLLMRPIHDGLALKIEEQESLKIYKAASMDQEVLLVLQNIQELLEKDPELELSDVMVLAPDIHLYHGFIQRHFEPHAKALAYKIMDSSLDDTQKAKAFIEALLSFAMGLWSFQNVLQLLQDPWLSQNIDAVKRLRWFRHANKAHGVSWGLSPKHRHDIARENEWQLLDETEKGCWQSFWSQIFESIAVKHEEGESSLLAGELSDMRLAKQFFSELEAGLSPWIEREALTPLVWIEKLEGLLKAWDPFLGDFAFLRDLRASFAFCEKEEIEAKDFNEILVSYLQDVPSSWSSAKEGLLRFASLQPMRALPVKHLFIMGLSQQHFPSSIQKMEYEWGPDEGIGIRPNSSEGLRFAFLESLLCARKSLCLTYSGSLQMMPVPSALLANLMAYLKVGFGQIEVEEPFKGEENAFIGKVYKNEKPLSLFFKENKQPEEASPFVLSLMQVEQALKNPLRLYLEHLWQIREASSSEECKELTIARPFVQVYSRLVQMDQQMDADKLLDQWEKGALSHLEADIWKSRFFDHRKYRADYLELALQTPKQVCFSQGRRWLNLPDEALDEASGKLYRHSLRIGERPCFELIGLTQAFDFEQPQIVVKSTAKEARPDLLKSLCHLALCFESGLIQNRQILLVSRKKGEKIKSWDLSAFNSRLWLENLAGYLQKALSMPLLFTEELYTECFSETIEEYEEALCSQFQSGSDKRNRKYSLQYMWGLYASHPALWESCLKNTLEVLGFYLKRLYEPVFEVYPLLSRKEKEDDEEF